MTVAKNKPTVETTTATIFLENITTLPTTATIISTLFNNNASEEKSKLF